MRRPELELVLLRTAESVRVWLTSPPQSETVGIGNRGGEMRIRAAAILGAFAGILSLLAPAAVAQTNLQSTRTAQASPPADALFTTPVRRPSRRVFIYPPSHWEPDVYPRYFPGPNAVRVCNATYVQEHRPSGTVIVPRMSCVWRPG
jgi:hypothetical protein